MIAGFLVVTIAALFLFRGQDSNGTTLRVERGQLKIASVTYGEFQEYLPLRSKVEPKNTVFLDATEGGKVQRILVEAGTYVKAGQPILELSNTGLQLDAISREAQVLEQINNLRTARLNMEREKLDLKSDMVEIQYQLKRLSRLKKNYELLASKAQVPKELLNETIDEYNYYVSRKTITEERQVYNKKLFEAQVNQLEESNAKLDRNLKMASKNVEDLLVKAPVSGYLVALNAELGESKSAGNRLGQIDQLDLLKMTAQVDEYYISRVSIGQQATIEINGKLYQLKLSKVYPQVVQGKFEVEFNFATAPAELRRGQSLELDLQLSDSQQAILLPKGSFYQASGGQWVFVLTPDGEIATRRDIKLGRNNPDYYEVLDGLQVGDKVVISDYKTYQQSGKLEILQ